jgi:class 3 adenylate cyclase
VNVGRSGLLLVGVAVILGCGGGYLIGRVNGRPLLGAFLGTFLSMIGWTISLLLPRPAAAAPAPLAAGWYPDPNGMTECRYFDGANWTSVTSESRMMAREVSVSSRTVGASCPRGRCSPVVRLGGPETRAHHLCPAYRAGPVRASLAGWAPCRWDRRVGMIVRHETRYVAVGEADVAYQVLSDGPVDLLFCYGLGSHIEVNRLIPTVAEFSDRLATFSRLITFDRRGLGASDGVSRNAVPTWEEWADDVGAVIEATQSKRPAIFAAVDSGPMAMMYAAMHPDQVSALVVLNTGARFIEADDYPIGIPREFADAVVEVVAESWGTEEFIGLANPTGDAEFVALTAQVCRASVTPRTASALMANYLASDVRQALPLIRVPTLVLQASDQLMAQLEVGRYLADHIEGATFVELPNGDMSFTRANLVVADLIEEFVTGGRPQRIVDVDRVLATVLFVDIVESTEHLAAVGDQAWATLLDRFRALVRAEVARFSGREINTRGDDLLATFDGSTRAVRCASAIVESARTLDVEVRAGLHTGEIERRDDDVAGVAVHIGARVSAQAAPGEVLVTSTLRDLTAGSGIEYVDRGTHALKGLPGEWHLLAVTNT